MKKFEDFEVISHDLLDTENLAKRLAKDIEPGDVIALIGPMGAGKTAFSKAFAKAVGVSGTVNSPTFTIMNEYSGGIMPVYHFDAYRIEDADEMYEIGFEEFIYGKGICLIEWADIIKEILPLSYILVKINMFGQNERRYTVRYISGDC